MFFRKRVFLGIFWLFFSKSENYYFPKQSKAFKISLTMFLLLFLSINWGSNFMLKYCLWGKQMVLSVVTTQYQNIIIKQHWRICHITVPTKYQEDLFGLSDLLMKQNAHLRGIVIIQHSSTYSNSLFLDASNRQNFSCQRYFSSHGKVLPHRLVQHEREKGRGNSATSAWSVFRGSSLVYANISLNKCLQLWYWYDIWSDISIFGKSSSFSKTRPL